MNEVEKQTFEPQTAAYEKIDAANAESFLKHEESKLKVFGSLHSVGAPRELFTSEAEGLYSDDILEEAKRRGRVLLTGNVSPKGGANVYGPSELSNEERIADADTNIHRFFEQHDIDPTQVRMLRPERDYTTPLGIVNLDEESIGLDEIGIPCPDKAGDFMYTRNPDIVLAARPADCPILFLTAETPEGTVTVLLHLATLGVAHNYIEQGKAALDELGVYWETARIQITPGAHADTYNFRNSATNPHEKFPAHKDMYVNFKKVVDESGGLTEDGKVKSLFNYDVELSAYVYEHVIDVFGVDPYQVFADTTNTPSSSSGTSSHNRTRKNYPVDGDNSRDVFVGIQQA